MKHRLTYDAEALRKGYEYMTSSGDRYDEMARVYANLAVVCERAVESKLPKEACHSLHQVVDHEMRRLTEGSVGAVEWRRVPVNMTHRLRYRVRDQRFILDWWNGQVWWETAHYTGDPGFGAYMVIEANEHPEQV